MTAQALSNEPMPASLRRAIRKQALSWDEALQIHHSSLMADSNQEWVQLPEPLWPAAERLNLLELRGQGGRQ